MLFSSMPIKFQLPWGKNAATGTLRVIPVGSQIGITPGAASFNDGFPVQTATPVGSGGTPPSIQDFNGILYDITGWNQWQQAGGPITYDAAFQTAIGGYPQGAVVNSATVFGVIWRSTVDNNTTNPDTGGAGWVSYIGSGFAPVYVTSTQLLTVPVGATRARAHGWGGGGGGGGCTATAASGGGGGGYFDDLVTGLVAGATIACTIGAAGAGGAAGVGGSAGGATSFGSYASASGGGGGWGAAGSLPSGSGVGGTATITTGTGLPVGGNAGGGGSGAAGAFYLSGGGGAAPFGGATAGANTGATPGTGGSFPGGGGSGAVGSGSFVGGTGGAGLIIIEFFP